MLSRDLECFLEVWNAFDRVGIPLCRVGILSTELEYLFTRLKCFLECRNAFDRVGITLCRVENLSRGLE
jgi:hypothetical protein